jgi:hypothetical protein
MELQIDNSIASRPRETIYQREISNFPYRSLFPVPCSLQSYRMSHAYTSMRASGTWRIHSRYMPPPRQPSLLHSPNIECDNATSAFIRNSLEYVRALSENVMPVFEEKEWNGKGRK